VTGIDLLQDLSVFFRALGGLVDGFRERAKQVKRLLGDPRTTFLLVTSPEREPVDEAIFFWSKLREAKMPFGGLVVNRVHHDALGEASTEDVLAALDGELDPKLAAKAAENLRDYHVLAVRDRDSVARLAEQLNSPATIEVPHLDDDVHDVEGLLQVQRYLFASDAARKKLLADVVS